MGICNVAGKDYLKPDNCNKMRGIAALVILFHHMIAYISFGKGIDFILQNIGASMATVFFFYSGYGLMYKLKKDEDYLKDFWKKRILNILILYLISNVIFIIFMLLSGPIEQIKSVFTDVKYGYPIVPYSWYIIVSLILYVLFYFSYIKNTIKRGTIILSILMMALCLLFVFIKFGEWWYNTYFAFLFGVIFSLYYDQVNEYLQKRTLLKFIVFALVFAALLILGKVIEQKALNLLIKVIRSIVFCIVFLIFTMILPRKSIVLDKVGKISLEMYLYQGLVMQLCSKFDLNKNAVIFAISSVLFLFLFATVINIFDKKVISIFVKK